MKRAVHDTLVLGLLCLLGGFLTLSGCESGDDSTSDDPNDPGSLVMSSDAYIVGEDGGRVVLTVNRVGGSSGSVSVNYTTQDGTATEGDADYQLTLGTLIFDDGVVSKVVEVTIYDDTDSEGTETFEFILSEPSGGADLLTPSSATVSIIDDEATPRYTFEDLFENEINGQDNWAEEVTNATIEKDITSANGTQIVRANVTSIAAGDTEISRVNDVNFSFPAFSSTMGLTCYDTTADDNSLFALGKDIVIDGLLKTDDNELGVPFGFWERQFAVGFGNSLDARAGVIKLTSEFGEITDWYRLCLEIDFTANGGDAAGSLLYMNLSRGDTSFTAIPGLQNLDLKLSLNSTPSPSEWNAMFLNLRVDSTDLIPKADNLMPNVLLP